MKKNFDSGICDVQFNILLFWNVSKALSVVQIFHYMKILCIDKQIKQFPNQRLFPKHPKS